MRKVSRGARRVAFEEGRGSHRPHGPWRIHTVVCKDDISRFVVASRYSEADLLKRLSDGSCGAWVPLNGGASHIENTVEVKYPEDEDDKQVPPMHVQVDMAVRETVKHFFRISGFDCDGAEYVRGGSHSHFLHRPWAPALGPAIEA